MERLSDFPAGPPEGSKAQKRKWVVELRDYSDRKGRVESDLRGKLESDRKGKIEANTALLEVNTALIVEHDEPMQAFNFDRPEADWGESPHTDSAIVADLDGEVVVCFIELTGRVTDDAEEGKLSPAARKLAQLEGVAKYFHPFERGTRHASTGARHHDGFVNGDDPLEVEAQKDHSVVGLVVASRQASRMPTPPVQIGSTVVNRLFVQLSLTHAPPPTVELRTLLKTWLKTHTP